MKRLTIALCGALLLLTFQAGLAQDTGRSGKSRGQDAALRYFDAMGYDEMMTDALELLSTQVPVEYRESMKSHFGRYMIEEYKPAMADLLVLHFTVQELEAMAEFYESDIGRSIADKMVPFTLDTMKVNEEHIMRMVVSYMEAHPELAE